MPQDDIPGIGKAETDRAESAASATIKWQSQAPKVLQLGSHRARVLVLIVYAVLTIRFFRIIWRHAVDIFSWDQWDFDDATLFQKHSLWEIFRWQHGPHRQGLGGVLQKWLEPLILWNTRYEAFGIAAIICLAATLALYLKKRLFGTIGYEDIIIPLLFLTPVQCEGVLSTANPAHGPLPLLLMILYCIALTATRNQVWWHVWILLINFLLIYTGFGLFAGLLTPLVIAAYWYQNEKDLPVQSQAVSAVAWLLSIASLLSFFVGYKLQSPAGCFSFRLKYPMHYPEFMGLMLANFLGLNTGVLLPEVVGGGILLVLLVCLVLSFTRLLSFRKTDWSHNAINFVLSAFCVLFSLGTAFGRLCFGLEAARESRYTTYLILGFFGLYLCAQSLRTPRLRRVSVCTMLILASCSYLRLQKYKMQGGDVSKRAWRSCYLARHDIQQCDALAHFKIYPWPEATHLQQKLDFLEQHHLNLYAEPNH